MTIDSSPSLGTPNVPRIDISFVVPVYNEEECLPFLYQGLLAVIKRLEPRYAVEVLLVDDGSTDSSWELIESISQEYKALAGLRLSRNFGHQVALSCGYHFARGRAVISIDADLQDPPAVALEMIQKWEEGADVVYAVRTTREGESWFKLATARLFYRLLRRLASSREPFDAGDFRLLSRRALEALNRMPERHRYVRGMVGWIGFQTATVEYARQPRAAGKTKYPLWKMMRLATDAIVSMSFTPLRLAYVMAALVALPFLAYLVYNLLLWMIWDVEMVKGWPSMILAITAFGSAILFVLGLMGEYVGRIYEESKRRPLFLVADKVPRNTGDAKRD
jgi:dolichol-phosphate mannosyltransferase